MNSDQQLVKGVLDGEPKDQTFCTTFAAEKDSKSSPSPVAGKRRVIDGKTK
jgi:hypothetical protein